MENTGHGRHVLAAGPQQNSGWMRWKNKWKTIKLRWNIWLVPVYQTWRFAKFLCFILLEIEYIIEIWIIDEKINTMSSELFECEFSTICGQKQLINTEEIVSKLIDNETLDWYLNSTYIKTTRKLEIVSVLQDFNRISNTPQEIHRIVLPLICCFYSRGCTKHNTALFNQPHLSKWLWGNTFLAVAI